MDCERTRERLQEARDGAPLPEGARVHLSRCEACAGFREAISEVDRALDADPVLEWRPELTARVLLAARRDRLRLRLAAAAAAAMLLAAAWLGAGLAEQVPAMPGLGIPETPEVSVASLGASAGDLYEDARTLLGGIPVGEGAPIAVAGLAVLLVLNAGVVGRLHAARGRQS